MVNWFFHKIIDFFIVKYTIKIFCAWEHYYKIIANQGCDEHFI